MKPLLHPFVWGVPGRKEEKVFLVSGGKARKRKGRDEEKDKEFFFLICKGKKKKCLFFLYIKRLSYRSAIKLSSGAHGLGSLHADPWALGSTVSR
jgi:hypothetical protein